MSIFGKKKGYSFHTSLVTKYNNLIWTKIWNESQIVLEIAL